MNIKMCNSCPNTPMIPTMAFPGAEYWCAKCGDRAGMFSGHPRTEETAEHSNYVSSTKTACGDYLSAAAMKFGAMRKDEVTGDLLSIGDLSPSEQAKIEADFAAGSPLAQSV